MPMMTMVTTTFTTVFQAQALRRIMTRPTGHSTMRKLKHDPEGLVVPLLLVARGHDVVGVLARAPLAAMGPSRRSCCCSRP